jgi:pimeloyl-ACP methyl ester carboxylesterase
MPFAESPGARLHWERQGEDGLAIVMSSGQAVPASLWGELPSRLARRCRVVTYDQRGIGESEAASDACTMEDAADDLQAVVAAAYGDEPVISLGHASGGWVAFVHAIREPEAVRALMLISTVGIFAPPAGLPQQGLRINPKQVEYEEYRDAIGPLYTGMGFAETPEGDAFLRESYAAGRARQGPSWHGYAMRDVDRMAYWARWTQPTLLLYGTHDRLGVPEHGFDLARALPDSELHWFYPAGHFLPREQPAKVSERILDWAGRLES